jgi:hypothetical protein
MIGRRQDIRNLCADLLDIHWKDDTGTTHDEVATLEDISSSGACVKMDQPVKINTILTIKYPNGKFVGRVKHCKSESIGYFIGVQFLKGYRWDQRKYRPEHLLQFRLKLVKGEL